MENVRLIKVSLADFITQIRLEIRCCGVLIQDIDEDFLAQVKPTMGAEIVTTNAEVASIKAGMVTESLGRIGDTLNIMEKILQKSIVIGIED